MASVPSFRITSVDLETTMAEHDSIHSDMASSEWSDSESTRAENGSVVDDVDDDITSPEWSGLLKDPPSDNTVFQKPKNFFDLPVEVRDIILGYACSNWGVKISMHSSPSPDQRHEIIMIAHPHSHDSVFGLVTLAETNKLLHEQLRYHLYNPGSFSGYIHLINVDLQALQKLQDFDIHVEIPVAAFWPTQEQCLSWILSATTVFQMRFTLWRFQARRLDIRKIFPNLKRAVLVRKWDLNCSTTTVREHRAAMVENVKRVSSSDEGRAFGIKGLVTNGVRVTMRHCRIRPRCLDFHPLILSMDIKPIPLPYHPANVRIRVGQRDFGSLCCPTGRSDDSTLEFAFGDLQVTGLGLELAGNKNSQPCHICQHWRLMWAGVNGDRKRFGEKERQSSEPSRTGRFC